MREHEVIVVRDFSLDPYNLIKTLPPQLNLFDRIFEKTVKMSTMINMTHFV